MKIIKLSTLSISISLIAQTSFADCNTLKVFDQKTKALKAEYNITVADTPESRARGLMFVKSLPDNHGMLFKWKHHDLRAMWMKNTYIPLDMIFMSDNNIIGLVENAVPHSLIARTIKKPVNKILEINAKEISNKNININDIAFCE